MGVFVVRRRNEHGRKGGRPLVQLLPSGRGQLAMQLPIILGRQFFVEIEDHRRRLPVPRRNRPQDAEEAGLRIDGGGAVGMRMQKDVGDDQFQGEPLLREKVDQQLSGRPTLEDAAGGAEGGKLGVERVNYAGDVRQREISTLEGGSVGVGGSGVGSSSVGGSGVGGSGVTLQQGQLSRMRDLQLEHESVLQRFDAVFRQRRRYFCVLETFADVGQEGGLDAAESRQVFGPLPAQFQRQQGLEGGRPIGNGDGADVVVRPIVGDVIAEFVFDDSALVAERYGGAAAAEERPRDGGGLAVEGRQGRKRIRLSKNGRYALKPGKEIIDRDKLMQQ